MVTAVKWWSRGVVVRFAASDVWGPEPQLSDDVGTVYEPLAASEYGGSGHYVVERAIPPEARRLTVAIGEAQVELELTR